MGERCLVCKANVSEIGVAALKLGDPKRSIERYTISPVDKAADLKFQARCGKRYQARLFNVIRSQNSPLPLPFSHRVSLKPRKHFAHI